MKENDLAILGVYVRCWYCNESTVKDYVISAANYKPVTVGTSLDGQVAITPHARNCIKLGWRAANDT